MWCRITSYNVCYTKLLRARRVLFPTGLGLLLRSIQRLLSGRKIGKRVSGKVVALTDYGAFLELEAGIEGLIHVSEMSWTKKNVHPGKIVSTSQEVEVVVLEVDPQKRRISLGLKQTQDNPWEAFLAQHPRGSEVEGPIRNITEFGLFIGLPGDIDGMAHLSDLSWSMPGEKRNNFV